MCITIHTQRFKEFNQIVQSHIVIVNLRFDFEFSWPKSPCNSHEVKAGLTHWNLRNCLRTTLILNERPGTARNQASPQDIHPLTMLRKRQRGTDSQSKQSEYFLTEFYLVWLSGLPFTSLPISIQFDLLSAPAFVSDSFFHLPSSATFCAPFFWNIWSYLDYNTES